MRTDSRDLLVVQDEISAVTSLGERPLEQPQPVDTSVATAPNKDVKAPDLHEAIGTLFRAARDERFEDGVDSEFARNLVFFIQEYASEAMKVIKALIWNEQVDPEVASEALRWLGRIEDPETYQERLWLLEASLFASSPAVRDGAGLGLASLDDPDAITYLRQAIERETYPPLRRYLGQTLEQLEDTLRCRSS
ncbi:MAG: HEAT repeat domain-containing protein [Ardenticatenaceae bacterium]|nr:HEAT repeat domain-containing protein [Ardenticatenaceae bacterium]